MDMKLGKIEITTPKTQPRRMNMVIWGPSGAGKTGMSYSPRISFKSDTITFNSNGDFVCRWGCAILEREQPRVRACCIGLKP